MLCCEARPNDHLEQVFRQLMRFADDFDRHGFSNAVLNVEGAGGLKLKPSFSPELGRLVRNLRGREEGKYAVIIGIEDERFVLIADGDKRKFDQPKKKNVLHLELLAAVSSEVADSLRETGRVTNGKLRYAIAKYVESKPNEEAQEKGE